MENEPDTEGGAPAEENADDTISSDGSEFVSIEEIEALPGVGVALASHLREGGYDSVEAICDASVDELTEINRLSKSMAVVLRLAAGATPSELDVDVVSLFDDLEDLPGINVDRAEVLREAGFMSPTDVREATVDDLTALPHVDTETARTLKRVTTLLEKFDSPVVEVDLSDLDREVNARHLQRQERRAVMLFSRLHSELDLGPGTMRFAVQTLKRAMNQDFLKRRSFTETLCASTVIASRATDNPRTIDEVAAIGGIDGGTLGRAVPDLTRALGLEVGTGTAEDFVDRYVEKIETARAEDDEAVVIPNEKVPAPGDAETVDSIRRRTRELLDARPGSGSGTSYQPSVVAASALYGAYLLEGVPVTQQTFADAFDTNCVSIRKHYVRLLEEAGYDTDAKQYQKVAREGDVAPADAVGD